MPTSGHSTMRVNDYDSEASTLQFRGVTVTAANFDAQFAALTSLIDAIGNITLGLKISQTFGNATQVLAPSTPSAYPAAQREKKWLVRYTDGVAMKNYRMEIPCADLSLLDENNRAYADMDDASIAAFVSAFEAFHRSEGGNPVTVESIQFVGRNV